MYADFAKVYDRFVGDDGAEWADFAERVWRSLDVAPRLVLELACGTGIVTEELARRGYEMIGVDISGEMLACARGKSGEGGDGKALYLEQDMRTFELYGTVDAAVCLRDGINHLLSIDDVTETFRLVRNYLNPGGIFLFDVNTERYFKDVLGDGTFAETREDCSYIWENMYDEYTGVNEYAVTFFNLLENGFYERFDELVTERAYDTAEIKDALKAAGLTLVGVYGDFSDKPAKDTDERIFFAARADK